MHPEVFLQYRRFVEEKAKVALENKQNPYKGLTKLESAFMEAHLKRAANARIGRTYKIED